MFKIKVDQTTGWIQEEEEIALYVLTENGRDYLAMSNICTHLGCRARWIPEQGEFFCPCHNGVFDKHGFVVSGPPPRSMDVFETKIANGELSILLPAKKRSARSLMTDNQVEPAFGFIRSSAWDITVEWPDGTMSM